MAYVLQFYVVDKLLGRNAERRDKQMVDMLFAVMEKVRDLFYVQRFVDMRVDIQKYFVYDFRALVSGEV